ncbi:hypothetical protein [Streptomyces sp. GSL17-111]|uniref:hypothetical protein n=1 Tax=Streptomyces sp. GSL17-111 TaxID=3121596 RepID=UPI0030F461BA
MTSSPLADAPRPAAAADVNDAIRRLMEQPADTRRAEEYVRLLSLWADTTTDWTTAA